MSRTFIRVLLALVASISFFAPLHAAAQESTPGPLIMGTLDTQLINAVNALILGSTQDDFFYPIFNGTPLTSVAMYWPRNECGSFAADGTTDVVLFYNDLDTSTFRMISGSDFTVDKVCFGLVSFHELPDELVNSTVEEIPQITESRASWCTICGNTEYFNLTTPVAERIAGYFADQQPTMTMPNNIIIELWSDGILLVLYGPIQIPDLPAAHAYWEITS